MTRAIDYYHFPQIDSTNGWAKSNVAHLNPDHLTVVTAGTQTAGKGRHSRPWVSPPSCNLYASYCLFVPKTRTDISNMPQVVALAAIEMCQKYGVHLRIKWPNDLLCDGKKMGGLLCDTTPVNEKICVIIGLGLNVNMPQKWLDKTGTKATSLHIEAGNAIDLWELTDQTHQHVCQALETFISRGFTPYLNLFRENLVHRLGDAMRFHVGSKVMEGSFHSINDDGTLNLILDDRIQQFASGEIIS